MSRLVEPVIPSVGGFTSKKKSTKNAAQDYLERVSRYIPGEILAAYLTGVGVFTAVSKDDPLRLPVYIFFFLICLGLTPVYLNFMAEKNKPKRLHLIVGSLAFVIWSYALGGLFIDLGVYRAYIGTIFLIIFSISSGLVYPKPGDP